MGSITPYEDRVSFAFAICDFQVRLGGGGTLYSVGVNSFVASRDWGVSASCANLMRIRRVVSSSSHEL